MNETRRKPTTGRQSPSLFDKWARIFYMPSRIDTAVPRPLITLCGALGEKPKCSAPRLLEPTTHRLPVEHTIPGAGNLFYPGPSQVYWVRQKPTTLTLRPTHSWGRYFHMPSHTDAIEHTKGYAYSAVEHWRGVIAWGGFEPTYCWFRIHHTTGTSELQRIPRNSPVSNSWATWCLYYVYLYSKWSLCNKEVSKRILSHRML